MPDIVIVDDQGNEHHFPEGFGGPGLTPEARAKAAGAIVRRQTSGGGDVTAAPKAKPEGFWETQGHRAAGVRQGAEDLADWKDLKQVPGLITDVSKQVGAQQHDLASTIGANAKAFGDFTSGALDTGKNMVTGAAKALWTLMQATPGLGPVPGNANPEAMAKAKTMLGALDPGGAEPNQNPTEKRWRRGTNVASMILMNKGMPWTKAADEARKTAEVGKAFDEAHAIAAFDNITPTVNNSIQFKNEAQQVARGLGAPPPKVVPPGGTPLSVEDHLAQALKQGASEAAAPDPNVGGVELPPPQFSLGARQPPEQPRWQILPKEMLTDEEEAARGAAAGGTPEGPAARTYNEPKKPPLSKPSYNGPERRGTNRIANEVEDKAYAQVRAALAKKGALERAKMALMPPAPPVTPAEAEGAAKASLPVATPEEAAPALAPVEPLKQKVQTWVDKWRGLQGPARTDFGNNIPSDVKQFMEDQLNQQGNAAPAIRKALGMGPLKKPTLVKPEVPVPVAGEAPVPAAPIQQAVPGSGFVKKKTMTLADMAEAYGPEEAARRAGMDVTELRARLAAGNDPDKLATLLRSELGADATARTLGVAPDDVRASSGGTPSRLPKQAVERLKAAADKELAETGQMSQRTAEGLARAQREEEKLGPFTAFGGFPNPFPFMREHPIATGAAVGGALGANMSDEGDNSDVTLAKALTGAGAGAGLAAAATNLPDFLRYAMGARREGFLSGGALAKNVMTAAGAPMHVATDVGWKEGLRSAKEMYNLPKNIGEFWDSLKHPPQHTTEYASGAADFGRYSFSNVIGAIDKTATKALERAGVGTKDIQRVLLTAERDMLGSDTSKLAREASRFILPFQRVPWNVFKESLEEMGHMWGDAKKSYEVVNDIANGRMSLTEAHKALPSARSVADIGAVAGGYGLGQWAGTDPKKKYAVSILLAAFGPRQAMGIMGAVVGMGTQGLAAGAVGGISPIPEQAFDPRAALGVKPAMLSAYEKLTGTKLINNGK